jgi:orotate phosphoribosyltransferase
MHITDTFRLMMTLFKKRLIVYVVAVKKQTHRAPHEKLVYALYRLYKSLGKRLYDVENPRAAGALLRARYHLERATNGSWRYVTMADMTEWTRQWITTFPETYDAIVGVPRSGLMVAMLIAGKLGKPVSTPERFGEELWISKHATVQPIKHVLLVEDSVSTGGSIEEAKTTLRHAIGDADIRVTVAALIVAPQATKHVDLFFKTVPAPRLFEWNLLHAHKDTTAVDLDGVLCEEPPEGIDADEERYRAWLMSARPYLIPAFTIDAIITNRLEKYRAETEVWLARHRVRYTALYMWDVPRPELRRDGGQARHKIATLLKLKPFIFWESGIKEAKEIFDKTNIPVLCVGENVLMS